MMSTLKKVPRFNDKAPSFDDDPRHDFFLNNRINWRPAVNINININDNFINNYK